MPRAVEVVAAAITPPPARARTDGTAANPPAGTGTPRIPIPTDPARTSTS